MIDKERSTYLRNLSEKRQIEEWKRYREHQKKKKNSLGKTYLEYISSKGWKSKARRLKQKFKKCQKCGYRNNLTVHHKHYQTLGRERDKDLIVLCWKCHQKQHPDKNGKVTIQSRKVQRKEEFSSLRMAKQSSRSISIIETADEKALNHLRSIQKEQD